MRAPAEITCVDCLGTCVLVSHAPEDELVDGEVVTYRCRDCQDRWDLVMGEDD